MQLVFILAIVVGFLPLLSCAGFETTKTLADSNTITLKATSNLTTKVALTTKVSNITQQTVSSTIISNSTPVPITKKLTSIKTNAPTNTATEAETTASTVRSTGAPIIQSTVASTEETTVETTEVTTDAPATAETTIEEDDSEAITTTATIQSEQNTYSKKPTVNANKTETKPSLHESEHLWSSHRKGLLLRCLTLGAHIHYLRRAMWKARNNEEVANNAPASNEVAVQLATIKDKFYNTGCNIVRRRLRYMRLDLAETLNALKEFSELFELLHMEPLLKPHLLRPQGENIAYPQVVPSKGRNSEEIQE
jgi:hypothetical protein